MIASLDEIGLFSCAFPRLFPVKVGGIEFIDFLFSRRAYFFLGE